MHIAIAGNIGSGKTTLTKMLVSHYGWIPKYESVDFNPYLADFYEDMNADLYDDCLEYDYSDDDMNKYDNYDEDNPYYSESDEDIKAESWYGFHEGY